ncbi:MULTISPECIES: DUF3833 family protein [Sphingomonas]|uniref:DUF3833 family protein n=1 Tax=Sphingomonas TaxID=13687 RepID=UPI000DEFB880|nr:MULTISPECIES: DUF3833 family protein [Sphingomonas]
MRQIFATSALVALAGCTEVQLPATATASLDPIAFFTGSSHGDGQFHEVLSSPHGVQVDSSGRRLPDGGLLLTQRIAEEGKAPRTREWIMRPAGPGRFTGSLTEAVGPVELTVEGPRAEVRYAMKKGLKVTQELALQPDGMTVLNHLEVHKLGLRVAWLDETIRKERR